MKMKPAFNNDDGKKTIHLKTIYKKLFKNYLHEKNK